MNKIKEGSPSEDYPHPFNPVQSQSSKQLDPSQEMEESISQIASRNLKRNGDEQTPDPRPLKRMAGNASDTMNEIQENGFWRKIWNTGINLCADKDMSIIPSAGPHQNVPEEKTRSLREEFYEEIKRQNTNVFIKEIEVKTNQASSEHKVVVDL